MLINLCIDGKSVFSHDISCLVVYSFVHRILTVAEVQETFLLSGCTNTYKTLGVGGGN